MKVAATIVLTSVSLYAIGQPNCNVFKMNGTEACFEACVTATEAEGAQGSRQSQTSFDRAIEMCPELDYAYMEKAVPYLKRGDFVTWKKLIDKAVNLKPTQHLGYRGWCRYQFLRDYRGAIADLELLDSLTEFDIGYSQNGDYHLNVAKALCYKALGEKEEAIAIIEQQLATPGYSAFMYDYLHLGVLKMESGDNKGAIEALNKSIAINDYLAEPYYHLGLIYSKSGRGSESLQHFQKAKEYYLKGYKRFDPYTHPADKVYLSQIEREIANH